MSKRKQRYLHRVACDASLMLDVETDSAETPLEELEKLAREQLRRAADGDDLNVDICLADVGFDIEHLEGGRVYLRIDHDANACDEVDRLLNFSREDTDEVPSPVIQSRGVDRGLLIPEAMIAKLGPVGASIEQAEINSCVMMLADVMRAIQRSGTSDADLREFTEKAFGEVTNA